MSSSTVVGNPGRIVLKVSDILLLHHEKEGGVDNKDNPKGAPLISSRKVASLDEDDNHRASG